MLTEKQKEMLKRKFDKGYTLIQFCNDLDLTYKNIGEWEEGRLTELIEDGDYLEYLGSKEEFYVYRPNNDYIEDFIEKTGEKIDAIEMIDWTDRREISTLLEYLRVKGLLFRLEEELELMRK